MHQLEIDWNGLHSAFQMNMPEVRCFLCRDDGSVVKLPPGDTRLPEVRSQPQRYVAIEAVPSRIQYQWLDEFIHSVEDDALRGRMEAAINGKGAFRRFKDILLTVPDERRRWFELRDVLIRKRIIDWVKEQGIEPTNEPEWDAPAPKKKAQNNPRDVEALRDFLIAWADDKDSSALEPLALEQLAQAVAETFKIKPRKL